jgi:hypothetical protein
LGAGKALFSLVFFPSFSVFFFPHPEWDKDTGSPVELNTARRQTSVLMSMKTRNLPVSAWLVAFGAGAVLIIGAFAHFVPASSLRSATDLSPNSPPLTRGDPPAEAVGAPALPSNLSPGLAEIIKLAQAHVEESVLLAYITNSGLVFSPSADEILYLSDLGLSQVVIGALVKTAPPSATPQNPQEIAAAPTSAASPAPAPASPPTGPLAPAIQPDAASGTSVFYNDLAPYGAWAQQPDYGLCWQPTVVTIDPNWSPYLDAGQWLYSDCGWYWASDYTWGWAVFHYGRWANVPRRGWVWLPGDQWGPGWVAWRSNPSYIGWAPLPPGVSLNVLAELTFNGVAAGPNATLGLAASAYSFVSAGSLTSRNLPRHVLPAGRAKDLVHDSVLLNNYTIVNNRIFNAGVSRETVAAAAHKAVPEVALRAVASPQAAGLAMDRKTLAVYVPPASSAGAAASAQSVTDKSRVQAQTDNVPSQEPAVLAENKYADEEVVPAEASKGDIAVQLPPLHYPASSSPPVVRHHDRNVIIASGSDATPANRDWPSGFGRTAVQHPATPAPAPRYDGFNPPARQGESPRLGVENRPAPVESRGAPVEPARAAPAPAPAPSSSGNSKSGKL